MNRRTNKHHCPIRSRLWGISLLLLFMFISTACRSSRGIESGEEVGLPTAGLLCDLDADKDVQTDDTQHVFNWENQAVPEDHPGRHFVERAYPNRKSPESRPRWQKNNPDLNGHHSIVFYGEPEDGSHLGDDLINMEGPDVYDHLTQGSGYTWLAVIKPYQQYSPLTNQYGKDINIFFGNLRNSSTEKCDWCGFWGGISTSPEYDMYFWAGARAYDSFDAFTGTTGHYRSDGNPHIFGRQMETDEWAVVGARMEAGTGRVNIEIFQGMSAVPVNKGAFWVEPGPDVADPEMMAVGTERDAADHPGAESYDGEMARLLIWERPLSTDEMTQALDYLKQLYFD